MIKRLLFIMLVALAALPAAAATTFSFTYEGQTLSYTVIDEEAKTVKTKEGSTYASWYPGNYVSGDVVIPSKVTFGNDEYTVTAIGYYSFYNRDGLTSVTIPETVTSIGGGAFLGCSGLTSVTIPEGVTFIGDHAFNSCYGLTSVTIPEGVTFIGDHAFNYCRGLTSVTIPETVTSIDQQAFQGCSGLTSLTIPESVTSIGRSAFYGCSGLTSVTIPGTVTSIGHYVFYGCSSLTSVTIPGTVTSIGDYAFSGCSGLSSVTIPEGVTSIGENAFNGCSELYNVHIPQSVTTIGENAFSSTGQTYGLTVWIDVKNCESIAKFPTNVQTVIFGKESDAAKLIGKFQTSYLYRCAYPDNISLSSLPSRVKKLAYPADSSVIEDYCIYDKDKTRLMLGARTGDFEIPSTVTSIDDFAFYYNYMTSVTIPEGVTSIGNYAFYYCSSLTSVTIPESVTSISDYAFSGCTGLTSVTIPGTVTSIGNSAFSGCSGLTSVTIPEGVTSIGTYAFGSCSSLTTVTIPEGVTSIGASTFAGCSSLTSVVIPKTVTSIGKTAFSGCSSLTSVTISEGVTSIGESAFSGCSSLKSVTIPKTVTYIASKGLPDLGTIYFNAENCSTWSSIYAQCVIFGKDVKKTTKIFSANDVKRCAYPESFISVPSISSTTVMIPYSDTSIIEDYHVYDYEKKTILFAPWTVGEYTVPLFVTAIGDKAFKNNTDLKSLTLSPSLRSIGSEAFNGCTALTSLTLSPSLRSIGADAFTGCSSLANIYSSVTPAPLINESSFAGLYETTVLNIPEDIIGDYNNPYTNWRLFGSNHLTGVAGGEVFEVDGLKYQYLTDGTARVVASDSYADLSSVSIPASVQIEVEPQEEDAEPQYKTVRVVAVGAGAFAGLENLTDVLIAEGISTIGSIAFKDCKALTGVSLPSTVTEIAPSVFEGCSALSSFDFSGITKIGSAAFTGTLLSSVSLPVASVVDDYAFADNGVSDLALNYGLLERIGSGAFKNSTLKELNLTPDHNLEIGNGAFESSAALATVTLGDNVVSVGNNAFKDCGKLKTLTVGKDVAEIGDNAFAGCIVATLNFVKDGALRRIGSGTFQNLRIRNTLDLPDSLEYIGDRAFYNPAGITKIVLPANRRLTIGSESFSQATRTTEIEFPEVISSIGEGAFKNNACEKLEIKADYIGSEAFIENRKLANLTIKGEGKIGDNAFSELPLLTNVNVTTGFVGKSAFKGCPELTEAYINAEETGTEAFSGCLKMRSVRFGDKVKTIGSSSFSGNTSLSEAHFGLGLEEIGDYAFNKTVIDSLSFPSAPVPDPKIVIGEKCFSNSLRYLSLGNRMKEIKQGLTVEPGADNPTAYVDLGSSIETIGSDDGYISITVHNQALVLPPSLKYIRAYVSADSLIIPASPDELCFKTFGNWAYEGANYYYVNRRFASNSIAFCKSNADIVFGDNKDAEIVLSSSLNSNTSSVMNSVHIGASVKKIDGYSAKRFTFDEGIEEISSITVTDGTQPLRLPASLKKINSMSASTLGELIFTDGDEPVEIAKGISLSGLKSFYMGRDVSESTGFTFEGKTKLESVIVGDKVSKINDNFFKGCTGLTKVVMSDNVSEIGSEAFRGCTGLDILSLSEKVETIGENAYAECNGFSRIVARGMVPPEGAAGFGSDVEDNVPLYVPDEVLDDYANSDLFWFFFDIRGFNDNIVESVETEGEIDTEFSVNSQFNIFDFVKFVIRFFGQVIHKAPLAKAPMRAEAEESPMKYLWFAPKPEIASVDQEGNITINGEGEAEIWAYALDGSDRKVVIGVNKLEEVGDLNKDGVVDATDLQLLINHVLNPSASTVHPAKADLNSDGNVDSADLQHHINKILSK